MTVYKVVFELTIRARSKIALFLRCEQSAWFSELAAHRDDMKVAEQSLRYVIEPEELEELTDLAA